MLVLLVPWETHHIRNSVPRLSCRSDCNGSYDAAICSGANCYKSSAQNEISIHGSLAGYAGATPYLRATRFAHRLFFRYGLSNKLEIAEMTVRHSVQIEP